MTFEIHADGLKGTPFWVGTIVPNGTYRDGTPRTSFRYLYPDGMLHDGCCALKDTYGDYGGYYRTREDAEKAIVAYHERQSPPVYLFYVS
jgi:hypothetical protein